MLFRSLLLDLGGGDPGQRQARDGGDDVEDDVDHVEHAADGDQDGADAEQAQDEPDHGEDEPDLADDVGEVVGDIADRRERGGGGAVLLVKLRVGRLGLVEARDRLAGNCITSAMTVKSVVIEPEAARLRLSTGAAPTGLGPWVDVPWAWDGPVGVVVVSTTAVSGEAVRRLLMSFRATFTSPTLTACIQRRSCGSAAMAARVSGE